MFKLFLRQWVFVLILGLLSACNGGGESSTLLASTKSTTTNTNTGSGTTTTVTPSTVYLSLSGQQIVPTSGRATVTVTSFDSADSSIVIPNVPIAISVTGAASLENVPSQTDYNGLASFTVVSSASETVQVTVTINSKSFTGNGIIAPIYFGGTVTADITTKGMVPADGITGATLQVSARDVYGIPIENINVLLSFPSDSFAVAAEAQGFTNASGNFITQITNTVPQVTSVTPIVGGFTSKTLPLTFGTTAVSVIPAQLDLVIKTNNVAANNTSAATVIVLARDAGGSPIPNIPVSISSDSATATLRVGSSTGTLFINGNTGTEGRFELYVTDTVEESVNLTATTSSSGETIEATAELVFKNPEIAEGQSKIASIALDPIINNGAKANGTDIVTLGGQVLDSNKSPVANTSVSVITSGGSARFDNNVKTNAYGIFFFSFTDTIAESFSVRVVSGDISSSLTNINFTAVEQSDTSTPTLPQSVTLLISPEKQLAGTGEDRQITLTAVVRDSSNTPLEGITVSIAATGATANSAIFDVGTQQTKSNGTAIFKLNNTQAGAFNVAATAYLLDEDGKLIGSAVNSEQKQVEFITAGIEVKELKATLVNNNQPATGTEENAIKIDVIARDASGAPMANVPILVLFSTGDAAVARPARGNTSSEGYFSTSITSTAAGDVSVTIAVEGTNIAHAPLIATFTAATSVIPTNIDLQIDNDGQLADGESRISITAIPRDNRGSPIAGVDIELFANSDTAVIADEGKGTTNTLGEFHTTVTNTVAQTVTITPTAAGVAYRDKAVNITFTAAAIPVPTTLSLNVVGNNPEAGSDQEAQLIVLARDQNGTPINDVPVTLRVSPGTGTDISGAAIFGEKGFSGKTSGSGTFETSIKSSQPGTVRVSADGSGIVSNTVDVSFKASEVTDPEVTSIELIASSLELGSQGSAEGITITALVKNQQNNLVSGAVVSFSADSGELQPIKTSETSTVLAGITDSTGRAQARLTTAGNRNNRDITIRATVATTTGETREASLVVKVTGTTISISGQDTVIVGSQPELAISLRDSASVGISGQTLLVESKLGNSFNNNRPVTNTNGQTSVVLLANTPGQDIITVTKEGGGASNGSFNVSISDDNFTLTATPDASVIDIPLNQDQEFLVHWDKIGTPQVNQEIILSATRGTIPSSVLTDFNGDARFTIRASNAGPAVISATAAVANGPSKQLEVAFIATNASLLTLQAEPSGIGVNTPGNTTEQSEIIAILRDSANNLVKGKRINFTLTDVTGGSLFPASATTDGFGRASTVYTSGTTPSGTEGVRIDAQVADAPGVNDSVILTVARKALFISLGTGNTISEPSETQYQIPYTVVAVDSQGVAVAEAPITLTLYPITYIKGHYCVPDSTSISPFQVGGDTICTSAIPYTDPSPATSVVICDAEDQNFNGILDSGEDINNNGMLDPRDFAVLNNGTVKTDKTGFASFNILYPQEYGNWAYAKLVATAVVAGTETRSEAIVSITCTKADCGTPKIIPAGVISPFGVGTSCFDKN